MENRFIKRKAYGFEITLPLSLETENVTFWENKIKHELGSCPQSFSVLFIILDRKKLNEYLQTSLVDIVNFLDFKKADKIIIFTNQDGLIDKINSVLSTVKLNLELEYYDISDENSAYEAQSLLDQLVFEYVKVA